MIVVTVRDIGHRDMCLLLENVHIRCKCSCYANILDHTQGWFDQKRTFYGFVPVLKEDLCLDWCDMLGGDIPRSRYKLGLLKQGRQIIPRNIMSLPDMPQSSIMRVNHAYWRSTCLLRCEWQAIHNEHGREQGEEECEESCESCELHGVNDLNNL